MAEKVEELPRVFAGNMVPFAGIATIVIGFALLLLLTTLLNISIPLLAYIIVLLIGTGITIASVNKQDAQPSWFSRLLGWAKKDMFSAAVAVIALLIVGYFAFSTFSYWWNNYSSSEIYAFTSQQEFQENWKVLSGNWQVKNGYLEGGGKIALKNAPEAEVAKIRVVPANKEIVDLSVGVGSHYEFKYWQDTQTGRTTKLHIAVLYDGVRIPPGRDWMYKQNDAPRSVSIEKSTLGDDFSIAIGDSFGDTETIGSVFPSPYKQYEPVKGIITISSSSVQLSRIEINQ